MKGLPKTTRTINGQKFHADSFYEHKSEAKERAVRCRDVYGWKTRVIKVHNYKEGKNWAVFVK